MAEEDEIDVMGDFNLDILSKNDSNMFENTTLVSQNTELLNCEYTIHPQWLLDKPSANPALWYNNASPDLDLDKQFEFESQSNEPQISTENCITDESGWTEKEKNLLNRGIEIFGKSNVNLSQFIGSRTPAEVKYYLKNFHSDVQLTYTPLNEDNIFDYNCVEETVISTDYNDAPFKCKVLDDNEIPASIEEVIAAVSTAKPTSPNRKRTNFKKSLDCAINYEDIPSGQSLLKSNYLKNENSAKSKSKNKIMISEKKVKKFKDNNSVKFKFKTKLKIMNHKAALNKRKTVLKSRKSYKSETESVKSEISDVQIVTGNGLGVPVCEGEEVIKIRKENDAEDSGSDIEIDVEDTDETQQNLNILPVNVKIKDGLNLPKEIEEIAPKEETETIKTVSKKMPPLSKLGQEVEKILMSKEYPTSEVILNPNEISDVEKYIFYEFFEGRPAKTPARFLRIRNHIINAWTSIKPNYVKKTSIRNGLRQCGDVNCIGRIHNYLEQIGVINFGCDQTSYIRPLYDTITLFPSTKEKSSSSSTVEPNNSMPKVESLARQRNKKKYINDGEGGYTLTHDERGEIINTTVVNEEPAIKHRSYIKKPSIRLIYCRPFSKEKHQEFTVELDLSALILMDLHAHMYLTEVMGLIGGYWNSHKKILYITRYEPCKNIAPSSTHCDMCPITQAIAADKLHGENLDILGWFHSHPTFAPEPSQQDLDTQLSVQQWIGNNKPCIGFILSPFSLHGALIASPYRCLIVDKKENFEDQLVPYKFKVDLISSRINIEDLLIKAKKIISSDCNVPDKSRINFSKVYFQDNSITYLDKYIYSIKMHLAKCSNINKMTCDAITDGLSKICINKLSS